MELVLHSISYAGVWPGQARLTLEEFVPRAAQLGYSSIMLVAKRPHLSLLDYPDRRPERRRNLRALIQEHGLSVACLAAYTDFTTGADRPDIPLAEQQMIYLTELAELARDLDCSLIRVFTGYERAGVSYDAAWQRVVDCLRTSAEQVADYGVTLAVQNHHDLGVHHESLLRIIQEVDHPNCRLAFDAWAPALQGIKGEPLAEAVRSLAPYIAHTTVADYRPLPRFTYRPELVNYVPEPPRMLAVPVGDSIIDYPTFFDTLAAGGFDGGVAYEMCSTLEGGGSLENLDRCARLFVQYMKRWATASTHTKEAVALAR